MDPATRVIPRPENPLDRRARRVGPRARRALASRARAPRRHAEGGPRAVLGARSGRPCSASALMRRCSSDAKLHDIPNTVERARANIARLGVRDAQRARARRRGDDARRPQRRRPRRDRSRACRRPLVLAVTVLSSQSGEGLASAASLAFEAKTQRARRCRRVGRGRAATCATVCGDEFCLVVPGIRPAGGNGHDQVRVLTPRGGDRARRRLPRRRSPDHRARTIRSASRAAILREIR